MLTNRFAKARVMMVQAHKGQMYGSVPYFNHPLEVANTVHDMFEDATEDQLIAALLHDTVEDTNVTIIDIAVEFGREVAVMVDLLTKDPTLTYRENIKRIINSGNVGAMRVKLADNLVNASGDKSDMSPERREKLESRYAWSIEQLSLTLGVEA